MAAFMRLRVMHDLEVPAEQAQLLAALQTAGQARLAAEAEQR